MKIALIGYGKMGKAIEAIATAKGHEVIHRIDMNNLHLLEPNELSKADVAIEFTTPATAVDNIMKCFAANVPVVVGTTGWLDRLPEVEERCKAGNHGFLCASNFSIGVNIFFEVNKRLAALMAPHKEYDVQMLEIHHTQKKDAPSGTAITLAEEILAVNSSKTKWVEGSAHNPGELGIASERIDPTPGTHTVTYTSDIDDISITHTAHNRQGFAAGAVAAAVYMVGKKGVYTMKDVLNL
ncbi:dihydrodipicolinate reductase [Chitinophaga skermanii]|uniref:4-hydroxy-tetrahydrodipicolinate reductase n=1 Tax=Chitinophaga skermanii TaxID=331697 RepID=A0A327QD36_9BACT|nr:4-hydroxy-tetrahydrodipicolinate reductase [Chitinophaga skermanii]RAJ02211.1 dihydrodipicolinate reductase [Chitinophaga skermanii]